MRVLFVIPYYKPAFVYGGPVRSISSLCKAMARAGAQATVFTTNANGQDQLDVPLGQPIDIDGVQVYYFRRIRGLLPFYSPNLGRACAQRIREFDLVHSSALWTYPMRAAASACRRYNVPRIESPRGGLMPWDLRHNYWKKWLYLALFERARLNAAAAIHCTDEMEQQAIKQLGLKPPTFVVPNPIEFTEFSSLPARGKLRSRLGLPESSMVTLFLSRISAKKGLDLAIRAFVDVAHKHPDAHFVVAGPDDDGSGRRAQWLTRQLGLQKQVHFIGMVTGEDRLSALADADLFILTSHSENFGMAAAEALAAGLPVLLSDQVGIARQVARAGAGAIVPLDVSSIAHAWSALLDNPGELKAMGKRGRKLVQQEYDADAVARRMLDVYYQVIQDWRTRTLK
ncbi:MAG: glycosyltransferase [Candidatus Methanomethyliaceae archaeon]